MKGFSFIFRVLIIILIPLLSAKPQWPSSVEEELIIGGGRYPQAVSDGDGGVIVCWTWYGGSGGAFMQRVDRYGHKCFPEPIRLRGWHDSEALVNIVSDGKGGVYALIRDLIFWDPNNLQIVNHHLRLHHVDSTGNFLWGRGGILIATPSDTTKYVIDNPSGRCIGDGYGNVIVAWRGSIDTNTYEYGHIFVQKYNYDGKSLWDSGGVQLTDRLIRCAHPGLCTDGNGGAYVYYGNLQRVDRYGRKRWGSGIKFPDSGVHNLNYDLQGGVYCIGFYYPNYPKGYLYCLRVDSSGAPIWSQRVFLDTIYSGIFPYRILSVTNADSSVSIVTPDNRLFRTSPDGEMLYESEGILVDTMREKVDKLLSGSDGSNVLVYGKGDGIYVSKFDRYGKPCWENQPILISKDKGNDYVMVGDAILNDDGSVIVVIHTGYGYIKIKRITKDGKIGMDDDRIVSEKSLRNLKDFKLIGSYPNPFNESIVVSYEIYRKTKVYLGIYTLKGRELIRLIYDEHYPGNYNIKWDGKDRYGKEVPSGVYIVVMKNNESVKSMKIALIK